MNEDGSVSIVSQKECVSLPVEACDCTVPKDEAELGDEEAAADNVDPLRWPHVRPPLGDVS